MTPIQAVCTAHSLAAPLLLRRAPLLRFSTSALRRDAQYQPPSPTPTPQSESPHRAFYKSWSRPIAKVLLGAMFTYQAAYWGWVKLESLEQQKERGEEIAELEGQLERLTGVRKGTP